MKTLRLLICRTTTVTFGSAMNLAAALVMMSRSCSGLQAGRLDVADERQRDVAVRPDGHVLRHVGVAPEHDAEHVVRTDGVVGRDRHAGGGGAGRLAAAGRRGHRRLAPAWREAARSGHWPPRPSGGRSTSSVPKHARRRITIAVFLIGGANGRLPVVNGPRSSKEQEPLAPGHVLDGRRPRPGPARAAARRLPGPAAASSGRDGPGATRRATAASGAASRGRVAAEVEVAPDFMDDVGIDRLSWWRRSRPSGRCPRGR